MNKIVTIIFALTICKTVFSQDIRLHCGDTELSCENGGKRHFYDIMYCPYTEYSDTNVIPFYVRQVNQTYLISRLGQKFIYSKVKLRNVVVVDTTNFEEIGKSKGWINNSMCDKKVKYAFEYYFSIQDSLNFYFTTIYDNNGNFLFDHQIPDIKVNPNFDNYLDVCQVCNIALMDTKFKGDIKSIKLDFDREKNIFVWVVKKPSLLSVKDKRTIHSRHLIIHAQTGKIIDYKTTKSRVVCALPPF
jgi:hypothetical protein